MKALRGIFFSAVALGYSSTGHAVDFGSDALFCNLQLHEETFFCGEAFTSISFFEASIIKTIVVHATFRGPGYNEMQSAQKQTNTLIPSSRRVKTALNPVHCAHRGTHSVTGFHEWIVVPGADPEGGVESFDSIYRSICDCGPPNY